ncbi:MAG: PilZ domain-containing protein [Deltaproteobacteria bacterium]|nr:PilZ domain-containing protein [Deltaproteobacteria bacterium]MBN2673199.1 PilZ domain-containing protein [Deltaproteobacteria bacterium]
MNANDRRRASRRKIDLQVTRQSGIQNDCCSVDDVSPTGIKIRKELGALPSTPICNLELHLVPGAVSTVIAGKCVWSTDEYEGFEFVSPSFSQQMIIERLSGNL